VPANSEVLRALQEQESQGGRAKMAGLREDCSGSSSNHEGTFSKLL